MPLARAKINLWLNVTGRRADGYHLLDSLVAFADLADTVEAAVSDSLTLTVDGPQAASLAGEADNLVLKAARLLADRAGVRAGAALALTKHIPVAAGLGGGSADAAAALRALATLWRVSLPPEVEFEMAARLGADVPMCLAGKTALVSGVGEQLAPAPPLPVCGLLLVNPRVALSTAEVFAARRGAFTTPRAADRPWTDLASLVAVLVQRGNDLTEAAATLRPVIVDVLAFLRQGHGARHAGMSGSGATCFALYDSPEIARRAATTVPAAWWHHAGTFASR